MELYGSKQTPRIATQANIRLVLDEARRLSMDYAHGSNWHSWQTITYIMDDILRMNLPSDRLQLPSASVLDGLAALIRYKYEESVAKSNANVLMETLSWEHVSILFESLTSSARNGTEITALLFDMPTLPQAD